MNIKYKNLRSGLEAICTEKEFEQIIAKFPDVFLPLEQLEATPPEAKTQKIDDKKTVV